LIKPFSFAIIPLYFRRCLPLKVIIMEIEIPKVYEPEKVEDKLYDFWQKNSQFSSLPKDGQKPFTIVIPPPNVTGVLHMGHALNNTLQDIIIRFRRMQGCNALWVPGTDHGGIATQNVVEKLLLSEGTNRHKLGRDKFLERMWSWRKESGDTILNQLKKLGCSLDWSRTRFTMDEVCSKAVMTAFVELYNKGLIYRGKRLVNWCPRCQTALSDIEVEHEEEIGKLWHIKYEIKPQKPSKGKKAAAEKEHLVVATTRPETMLGDTAVAVNPKDKRYKKLVGRTILLPLTQREIPIVADEAVDATFGTGAVKVTPAHDPTDFDIAQRSKLPMIVVIDTKGAMTPEAGAKYAGLDRYAARKAVLEDLEAQGLLLETAQHPHSIGHCYRCDTVIEPLISEQWFLKVEDMSKRAMKAVTDGKLKFYPASWEKPYLLWLENLKDWCISRQIWWGHRIPVYYCKSEKGKDGKPCKPVASAVPLEKCPNCGGAVEQDPDVLDTWFSSALWPFSVFGWPNGKESQISDFKSQISDLSYYYPTSVLVTGHEILYLWVARMVQMGLEFMNNIPFSEVYIHGIVRDKSGKKMSKSLGNVIDPLGVMKKYGTDALRFSLSQSAAPGRDMQLSDDSFLGARNFANKMWNASRFVLMNLQSVFWEPGYMAIWPLELADTWILSEYRQLVKDVTSSLEKYDIDQAARLLYEFFWSKYCDWYIEIAKIRLNGQDDASKKVALSILIEVLGGFLRLMHPIMPFITEEIWQTLIKFLRSPSQIKSISIMTYKWPEFDEAKLEKDSLAKMQIIMDVVSAIRTIRSEMNVPPGKPIKVIFNVSEKDASSVLEAHQPYLKALAKLEEINIGSTVERPPQSATAVVRGVEIFVPLAGLIDLEKEIARLEKEIVNAEGEEKRCEQNLANEGFIKRAPAVEVERVRTRLKDARLKAERLKDNIKSLKN